MTAIGAVTHADNQPFSRRLSLEVLAQPLGPDRPLVEGRSGSIARPGVPLPLLGFGQELHPRLPGRCQKVDRVVDLGRRPAAPRDAETSHKPLPCGLKAEEIELLDALVQAGHA